MSKKIIMLGGIEAGGMGYDFRNDKDYITFKNDRGEDLVCLDYINLGEKYYWTSDANGEPPYEDFKFETYDSEKDANLSKEAEFYPAQGYSLKKDIIYQIITYTEKNKSFSEDKKCFWMVDSFDEYIAPKNMLKHFLAENVAQDIIDDKGIQLGTEDFKTISYYQEDMKYSIVVAKEGYAIAIETNIDKKDIDAALEMVKGMTTFHVIEGTQIDDKLVGKIWEE